MKHNEPEPHEITVHQEGWGMWDTMSLIVGIVVGTAIFRSPPLVFSLAPSVWGSLAMWLLGGILSLLGGLCYAELTTSFRRAGGDYWYLRLAYGWRVAFLFGWAQLTVIMTGNIGSMAYVFADYAVEVWPNAAGYETPLALAAVLGLSGANLWGIHAGRITQNLLTLSKVVGLSGILGAALVPWWAGGGAAASVPAVDAAAAQATGPAWNVGLALVFVMYAYGGWNDAALIAAEVRNPRRNLPWALLGGVVAITVIYLLINVSYLSVLGLQGAANTSVPAADVLRIALDRFGYGEIAGKVLSLLVMISALGAINGLIVAGSRLFAAWSAQTPGWSWMARAATAAGVPWGSIVSQSVAASLLISLVGTERGRATLDAIVRGCGLHALDWAKYDGGFGLLVAATAPVFWLFFFLTIAAVIILRYRYPDQERPFRLPGYPWPVLVFAATCLYMLYSSLVWAEWLTLIGVISLVVGWCWTWCIGGREAGSQVRSEGLR